MEKEIIALLYEKDYQGLSKLIDYMGADIVYTIRRILNHSEEQSVHKEVENEVFYKIWKKITTYDQQKSSLKTWCLTITRNTCLDKKRAIVRESQLVPIEQVENQEAIEDTYFEKEQFLSLIETLSTADQLIFLKYYFYQDSPKEIAELLQVDVSAVYNRLSRGRSKLRNVLSKGES